LYTYYGGPAVWEIGAPVRRGPAQKQNSKIESLSHTLKPNININDIYEHIIV